MISDVTLDVELPIRDATAKKYLFLEHVELRIGYRIPRSPPILIRRDSLYYGKVRPKLVVVHERSTVRTRCTGLFPDVHLHIFDFRGRARFDWLSTSCYFITGLLYCERVVPDLRDIK